MKLKQKIAQYWMNFILTIGILVLITGVITAFIYMPFLILVFVLLVFTTWAMDNI